MDAVRGTCEVFFDGGIRSGQDVAKALALAILREELRVTLALTSTATVAAAGPQMLVTEP